MASSVNAVLCATVAAAFWTLLGYALARHLLPRVLAVGTAPVIGWAVVSAATLPVLTLLGFSPAALIIAAVLLAAAAGISLLTGPTVGAAEATPAIPGWTCGLAAILALVPAAAILPKFSAAGVHLADPIFDHSKIAIIDAMTRQGLPPINPVFGEFGAAGRVAYYYLWHFSAAELALPLRVSGWEADIGLTWFTAFASLMLMMGLAVWIGNRSAAALWVVLFAATASLRTVLGMVFGAYGLEPFLAPPSGFAGWLFQSSWVPQHLMAACCVIAALLLIVQFAQRQSWGLLLTLVLLVAAGFESSTYVGGVVFAIAALAAAPILFTGIAPKHRLRFSVGMVVAAALAVGLAAPFILDQLATVAARGGKPPIIVHHFEVLGEMFPPTLRRILDVPAYWLILLPIEFPAIYFAGAIAFAAMLRNAQHGPVKTATAVLAALAAVGLCVSWLLVSTLGDNNDLSLRAVLPAAMVLIVAAAAGMTLIPRRASIAALALIGLVLGLPDTVAMIRSNIDGTPQPDAATFAQSSDVWSAVRRYASPTARIANNPLFLQDLTPWPANISWALLANRSSCFAGRELALAFAPLSPDRRAAIDTQFIRVFAGQGNANDVGELARTYGCDVVVVVPQDGAWSNDPFAASPDYRLAENNDRRWRIYLSVSAKPDVKPDARR